MGSRALIRPNHRTTNAIAVLPHVASRFGFSHATAAGRGRSALALALKAAALPKGSPVVLAANICPSVIAAIRWAELVPVCVPVALGTGLPAEADMIAALDLAPRAGAVLIAHLYGLYARQHDLVDAARQRNWFVIESDPLAARLFVPDGERLASDALVASFGDGKGIDAQGGGALLVQDDALGLEADRLVAEWSGLSDADVAHEHHLMLHRRALRSRGEAGLYEACLMQEMRAIPRAAAFDADALANALAGLEQKREQAQAAWERWRDALGSHPIAIGPKPDFAWRLLGICSSQRARDRKLEELRANGVHAGANYPAAAIFFPSLADQSDRLATDEFGDRVINLWLDDAHDRRFDTILRILDQVA